MQSLSAFADHVAEVCPLPATARKIMELCQSERVMLPELAKVITTDPALAAAVLRIANSAAYGGRGIDQLDIALMRIGLRELRDMAAAMSLLAAFRSPAELALELHDRSVVSGAIGSLLAKTTGLCHAGTAFTTGLLCEIGAMACVSVDGKQYLKIWAEAHDNEPLRSELERATYGFTSLEVGGHFLERNGLPASVSQAVATPCDANTAVAEPLAKITVLGRRATSFLVSKRPLAAGELERALEELALTAGVPGIDGPRLLELSIKAGASAERALRGAR